MNSKLIISLIAGLLLLGSVIADDINQYYCPSPSENWRKSNLTSVVRCYQKLPANYRSNLNSACASIGGVPINIQTFDMGTEVTRILGNFTYYGIWLDAANDGTGYNWIDGRAAPSPMQWCSGASKTFVNLVLLCPYPNYSSYSMSTCCLSDRTDTTKFAGMCTAEAQTDCQYVDGRKIKADATKYKFINSATTTGGIYGHEDCCRICTRNPRCAIYDYEKSTSTCYFYQTLVTTADIMYAVDATTNQNWIAGALYVRLG